MRIPDSLLSLVDHGIIDEVVRPLMSGKEAQVYLVMRGGHQYVAKIYKDADNRTFRNRAEYTEGRKVRNTRDQRAIAKRTKHGRAQDEATWRTTEVDMIYRLRSAGVRVPEPHHFIDGVLIMELVTDAQGYPAMRLGDCHLDAVEAKHIFEHLLGEVIRMLCAGVVHGDLSDFNVLMSGDGPVIIDFPQAVNASSNQNARKLLLRDVDNLHRFMRDRVPDYQPLPYAQEMWHLYERNHLTPDTKLTGRFRAPEQKVRTDDVLGLISDAAREEQRRREGLRIAMRGVPKPQSGGGHQDARGAARGQQQDGRQGGRGQGHQGRGQGHQAGRQGHQGRGQGHQARDQGQGARGQGQHVRGAARAQNRDGQAVTHGQRAEPRRDSNAASTLGSRMDPPASAGQRDHRGRDRQRHHGGQGQARPQVEVRHHQGPRTHEHGKPGSDARHRQDQRHIEPARASVDSERAPSEDTRTTPSRKS